MKVRKQIDEREADEMFEEDVEETNIEEEPVVNSDDLENKVDELMMKLSEITEIVSELASAVKSVVDVNRGIQETVMKALEEIEKRLPRPEEENKKVEEDRANKPREPSATVTGQKVDVEPADVQREPEYEFKKRAVKTVVTPRPELDKDTEVFKNDNSGMSSFIADVLKGKATVGEIEEKLKKVLRGEGI